MLSEKKLWHIPMHSLLLAGAGFLHIFRHDLLQFRTFFAYFYARAFCHTVGMNAFFCFGSSAADFSESHVLFLMKALVLYVMVLGMVESYSAPCHWMFGNARTLRTESRNLGFERITGLSSL